MLVTLEKAISALPKDVRINILTTSEGKAFLKQSLNIRDLKIYARKSYWAKALIAYTSRSKFIAKVDDDVFMTEESWLKFLGHVEELGPFEICSPVISTGIPSVELFLDNYLTPQESSQIRQQLTSTRFPKALWGVDYSSLNGKYDLGIEEFLQAVGDLPTHFKGIHPVRLDSDAQRMLLDLAFQAISRGRLTKNPKTVMARTYFCNNIYALSRHSALRLVLGTLLGRLPFDGYDELAINGLLKSCNTGNVVILDSLAVHPSFNSARGFQEIKAKMYRNVELLVNSI